MKHKAAVLLAGIGLSIGLMGSAASAKPFDGQCVGNSAAAAAKANGGTGFDMAGFVRYIQQNDCATP